MASLFSSFRIAPGVRLSTSPRGLRAHVGPRGMRMHVGGGGTGVSTGAGPFTVYQGVGGAGARTSRGSGTNPASKSQEHLEAAEVLAQINRLHAADFPAAARAEAPMPRLPKFQKLLATAEKQTLKGVGPFDRTERKAARARARQLAETWAVDLLRKANDEQLAAQLAIDTRWEALHRNVPEVVLAALAESIRVNRAPAQVVSVIGDVASLIVDAPTDGEVPLRKPAMTRAGAQTVANLNKSERAQIYQQLVAARILLVAKQAFASAPGLGVVRIVARASADSLGHGAPVVAAHVQSKKLQEVDFAALAWPILEWLDPELRAKVRGRARELQTVDLSRDPVFSPMLAHAGRAQS